MVAADAFSVPKRLRDMHDSSEALSQRLSSRVFSFHVTVSFSRVLSARHDPAAKLFFVFLFCVCLDHGGLFARGLIRLDPLL